MSSGSHLEDGLMQRAWLSQGNTEETERNPEEIKQILEENLETVDRGFSPSNIEALQGAPDEVVEAGSGESIEEIDIDRVAEFLSTEKWNYPFDADISEGEAEIAVDEARFDLWHSGTTKVSANYNNTEDLRPGIRALRETYPDTEIKFDGALYSRKPQDAQQRYEEAAQAKKEKLIEELIRDPDDMVEGLAQVREDIPVVDEDSISELLSGVNLSLKRNLREQRQGEEDEYKQLAKQARGLVLEDAVTRLQEAGMEVHPDDRNYEDFSEVKQIPGEGTPPIVDLKDETGSELQFHLYAEVPYDLGFGQTIETGYQLKADDEEGLNAIINFYNQNTD
jgi:hypothetical protein